MKILQNINYPAPKSYRKFENAYTVLIAPALVGAIQGWGLSDSVANHYMILLTISVAVVKGIGMLSRNGEVYATTSTTEITNDSKSTI
jgi:hypothetical protein